MVISSVPNVAHLLDRRAGNQIQVCLISKYTNAFPVVHASWKKKKKSLENYPSLFDKCLEKILGCDSHPTYELTYIWCQTPACGFQNSCFVGCFIKRSQINESVRWDGKPQSTLACIYTLVGIKFQVIIGQISKFTPALVLLTIKRCDFCLTREILYPFYSPNREMV